MTSANVAPATEGLTVPVRVWDPVVRLFHWSLVTCVVLNQFVLEAGEAPHQWVGYAACTWVVIRTVWGFIGTPHARFRSFWPTPQRILAHGQQLVQRQHVAYVGHSPLGAVMMLSLMALVLSLGLTGWMQGLDAFWGEEWLQETHETMANLLITLAGLHAAAALILSRLERVNLVGAMIHGIKKPF